MDADAVVKSTTALSLLNLETRAHHAAIDGFWRSLGAETAVRVGYTRRLRSVYGFEASFEGACACTAGLGELRMWRTARAGLIAKDLLALGMRPSEISKLPLCTIAPFESLVEAYGWIYAVERATMVHGETRREIARRVPALADTLGYLEACSETVGPRWDELGETLERVSGTDAKRAELVEAAHEGCRRLIAWRRATLAEPT